VARRALLDRVARMLQPPSSPMRTFNKQPFFYNIGTIYYIYYI
jgi:hypothetical protein